MSSERTLPEFFPNPSPSRNYEIEITALEFTSLCPLTGQPDFGEIVVRYFPLERCVELKSLKLYLQQYRNVGAFYEELTNQILTDLVEALAPKSMEIVASFSIRGGIRSRITATYNS